MEIILSEYAGFCFGVRRAVDTIYELRNKTDKKIYAIETNFYGSGGSKLNETARSYKTIAMEAKTIPNFEFVWFTDGIGWASAKNNLEETFDVLDDIYNINDMENGIIKKNVKGEKQ